MYATVTLLTEEIVKDEVLEIVSYHTTRFYALRARGPMVEVILRDNGPFLVWANEITITP